MPANSPADGTGSAQSLTAAPADGIDRRSIAADGPTPGERVPLHASFADADRDAWRATLDALAALEVTR